MLIYSFRILISITFVVNLGFLLLLHIGKTMGNLMIQYYHRIQTIKVEFYVHLLLTFIQRKYNYPQMVIVYYKISFIQILIWSTVLVRPVRCRYQDHSSNLYSRISSTGYIQNILINQNVTCIGHLLLTRQMMLWIVQIGRMEKLDGLQPTHLYQT